MAHAIALPFNARARAPLDVTRITASAGTILVNAVLLLLLLIPLSEPLRHAPAKPDEPIVIFSIPMKEPPPLPFVTPLPVVPQRPAPTTQPLRRPEPVTPVQQDVVVDAQPGDIAIEAVDVATDPVPDADPMPPSTGAQLQTRVAPPPPYPGEAMRHGLSGIVELEILVGIDGRPLDVRVVRSSGHRVLDQSARRTVLSRWTFVPAMRNGQPVQALGRVPIEFTLGG